MRTLRSTQCSRTPSRRADQRLIWWSGQTFMQKRNSTDSWLTSGRVVICKKWYVRTNLKSQILESVIGQNEETEVRIAQFTIKSFGGDAIFADVWLHSGTLQISLNVSIFYRIELLLYPPAPQGRNCRLNRLTLIVRISPLFAWYKGYSLSSGQSPQYQSVQRRSQ